MSVYLSSLVPLILLIALVAAGDPASALQTTLTRVGNSDSEVQLQYSDAFGNASNSRATISALPDIGTLQLNAFAQDSLVEWSVANSRLELNLDLIGSLIQVEQRHSAFIKIGFSVDEETPWSIAGLIDVTVPDGRAVISSNLTEPTANTVLYQFDRDLSRITGQFDLSSTSSASGTLLPNRNYEWFVDLELTKTGNPGAQANFGIGMAVLVLPEPSTALLLGLGLAALAHRR